MLAAEKKGKDSLSIRLISTSWFHPIIWSGRSTVCSFRTQAMPKGIML
jgi:hypothetical protein